ncbi:hypothetical protein [Pseudarthrobacter sp. AB1]|uniref:hypothetical protein n=1 Tax=Pseudarthrobacter sp. AB1 TaxID=2138309 RepID=UPI00186BB28F|nr:hypothetical protein [Pseudarthrobacter sp. AB1]MBE4720112.1 hypothetical protein [Pseudarthrobacter sp. AB1]
MAATGSVRVTAFLTRAVLLTGFLAIVAGILGMHIMTGAHSMPTATPGMDTAVQQIQNPVSHPGRAPAQSSQTASAAGPGMLAGSASSCADATNAAGCQSMSAMDAVCVLSPANTSLSAPLPGTAPLQTPDTNALAKATISYSFPPESPSPGDLCISRT